MKTMPRLSLIVLSLVVFLTGFAAAPAAAALPAAAVPRGQHQLRAARAGRSGDEWALRQPEHDF